MSSPNGLICFTNCLLPTEDGSLVEQDLWIDERRGVVLDAQVSVMFVVILLFCMFMRLFRRKRSSNVVRGQTESSTSAVTSLGTHCTSVTGSPIADLRFSPGYLDIQINGAYGFDFSVFEGDHEAYRNGIKHVAEKIVETGVTS